MTAQCSAPPSEPAKSAFFGLRMTDGAFEGAVVELDTAVIKEARQSLPAGERIADGAGELALLTDQTKLCRSRSYSWNASASGRPLCCRMRRRSSALRPRMSFSMANNWAMCFSYSRMSALGTSSEVRSSVANGGRPDMARTDQLVANDPHVWSGRALQE